MQASSCRAQLDAAYPPLPESGSLEDSDFAQRNFSDRRRLSRSWHARLFSMRRPGVSLLEKRSVLPSSNSTSRTSISSAHSDAIPVAPSDSVPGPSHRSESSATDTGKISLREPDERDPSRDEHLYRWAMVYENQRGISIFSMRRYSSRSLLPRDPPAYSIVAPAFSIVDGRPVRKSLQPDAPLADFPLPDGNWRWASKEWMVDMRYETVQHDGFEYNWFFRSNGWRSKAGRLNAGAWVRRRRWIRLMERPPLGSLKEIEGSDAGRASKQRTTVASINLDDVWCGDEEDWLRLRRAMRELGRDNRKLEAWKSWITAAKWNNARTMTASPILDSMNRVLKTHIGDLLRSFVYPSSRVEFLQMVTTHGLMQEEEVLTVGKTNSTFVDRTRLSEALTAESQCSLVLLK